MSNDLTESTSDRPSGLSRRALSMLGIAGIAAAGSTALAQPALALPTKVALAASTTTVSSVAQLTAGTADGEQIYLLGYHATFPGVGGGPLYWDANSTEAANTGTIFAVGGTATGRWKRPVTDEVEAAWFGVVPGNTSDQSARIQAAVNALPNGGKITFGPGVFRINNTIIVKRSPITFIGAGAGDLRDTPPDPFKEYDYGTQFLIKTVNKDAFLLRVYAVADSGTFKCAEMSSPPPTCDRS